MDKLDELLISHDELEIICQTMMEIILRAGLHKKLNAALAAKQIKPGFAKRSEEVKEKFRRERLMLVSTGEIQ